MMSNSNPQLDEIDLRLVLLIYILNEKTKTKMIKS